MTRGLRSWSILTFVFRFRRSIIEERTSIWRIDRIENNKFISSYTTGIVLNYPWCVLQECCWSWNSKHHCHWLFMLLLLILLLHNDKIYVNRDNFLIIIKLKVRKKTVPKTLYSSFPIIDYQIEMLCINKYT